MTTQGVMVSILVPVYNAAPYLRECVGSLTGQTFTDLQIVLINDGSTDDSWTILKELAHTDSRLEIYSQRNCGVAATRQHLLDKARGEFVLFVDSDDWIEPETVEVLLQEQGRENYDMVMFQSSVSTGHQETLTQDQAVKRFLEHRSFRGTLWNKLMRTCMLENVRVDQTVSYGEDAMMVWQVLQQLASVSIIDKALYHYRDNEESLSRQRFNGKKFTSYTTWDMICRDVDESWPQYSDIAHARFACEMTQVLRAAALSGSKRDNSIRLLQEEVRRDGAKISRTGISSRKMGLYAWLVSRHYWLVKQLSPYLR